MEGTPGSAARRSGGFDASELVSLAERVVYLQAFRVAAAVIVLASAVLAQRLVGATFTELFLATAVFVILAAGIEVVRRMGTGRNLYLISIMLLFDGVYLAWALYATGGTQSPLRFLVYLHLIAVTLLASYRTGLKIALWHSLLFLVVFYAQAAEILTPTEVVGGLSPESPQFTTASVFNVMAFWMVAIGTAFFSSLNERELRRRKADLEDLAKMASAMEEAEGPAAIAQSLLDSVCKSFGFKRGVVFGDLSSQAALIARRSPVDLPDPESGIDTIVSDAWGSKVFKLIKKPDPGGDPRTSALLPMARNLIVVPLLAEGHPVGALVVEHPKDRGVRVERRMITMLEQFCAHGALALRNAELMDQVRHMADTDSLTGLANRRTFEDALARELSRAERSGEPVTLMMVDVDHFKKFNDNYGHQAGDEVLRLVSGALREGSRDFDTPARYGGEEFVVILPACSSKESIAVGDRLRNLVGAVDAVAPVTASAGVATFPVHASSARDLIEAADEALYASKHAGRDQISRSKRRARTRGKTSAPGVSPVDLAAEDVTT